MARPGALRSLILDSKEGLSLTPLQVVQIRRFVENDFHGLWNGDRSQSEEVGIMLFLEPRTVLGIPAQVEPRTINPGDLIDKLLALQQQNSDLQQLVCYLLQKNELLRMEAWGSGGEI